MHYPNLLGRRVVRNNRRKRWKTEQGITISGMALYGVNHAESKIVEPVEKHWTIAIGITPCTQIAIKSFEEAPYVKAR